METIAVYFEPRIKTYGFALFCGLRMLEWSLPPERIEPWAAAISSLDAPGASFAFVSAWQTGTAEMTVRCIASEEVAERLVAWAAGKDEPTLFRRGVDALYFHGPHFNERPGIAAETVSALRRAQIFPIAMGCSTASVHLVFSEGMGGRAKTCLEAAFEVPKGKGGKADRTDVDGTGKKGK